MDEVRVSGVTTTANSLLRVVGAGALTLTDLEVEAVQADSNNYAGRMIDIDPAAAAAVEISTGIKFLDTDFGASRAVNVGGSVRSLSLRDVEFENCTVVAGVGILTTNDAQELTISNITAMGIQL